MDLATAVIVAAVIGAVTTIFVRFLPLRPPGGEEPKDAIEKVHSARLRRRRVIIRIVSCGVALVFVIGFYLKTLPVERPIDGLVYARIPRGSFQMGCVPRDRECREDEEVRYTVEITKEFWIGRTPVIVKDYKRFVQETGRGMPEAPNFDPEWRKEDHPIVRVTWNEAKVYCEWAGGGLLPTEAQWEYAARGREEGLKYPWGNEISEEDANYGQNAPWSGTSPAWSFQGNCYGVYDMAGNVGEWVADRYGDYPKGSWRDPTGSEIGTERIVRGGSWRGDASDLRLSARHHRPPDDRSSAIGFRCVLVAR